MDFPISIIQGVVAVVLVMVILLQVKGSGLSSTFGGSGEVFSAKRGVEKLLHRITVVLGIVFVLISLWQMFV